MHRHVRRCFGCSEATDRSLRITRSVGRGGVGEVEGRVRFGHEHVGAPGLVHGGLLATLADEVMGSVEHGGDGVRLTAELTIRYRRPVAVERDLVCRARVDDSSGRRYTVVSVIVGADDPDVVLAEAEATFVLVDDPASRP